MRISKVTKKDRLTVVLLAIAGEIVISPAGFSGMDQDCVFAVFSPDDARIVGSGGSNFWQLTSIGLGSMTL